MDQQASQGYKPRKSNCIKVYIRPRPLNRMEIESNCKTVITSITNHELVLKRGNKERKYCYDHVFRESTPQIDVFRIVVKPMIPNIIAGINCTVLAYGQTGTGKTHTLNGELGFDMAALNGLQYNNSTSSDDNGSQYPPSQLAVHQNVFAGMIPRSAVELFDALHRLDQSVSYTVHLSYIEIYNEEVRDLLIDVDAVPSTMKIYNDTSNKGAVKITNLIEVTVVDYWHVMNCIAYGNKNRQTAATNLNSHSSRSHAVLTLTVHTKEVSDVGKQVLKVGKLNLVDLAGSENISRSGATDQRAKETANINKSLLTLGKVIQALAKRAAHVPFRESKLTRILFDSLGGNTKTSMIATISPSTLAWEETVNTLEYAIVTRGIENCPEINVDISYSKRVCELEVEINTLQRELNAARAGQGFFMSTEGYQQLTTQLKDHQEAVRKYQAIETGYMKRIDELSAVMAALRDDHDRLIESFAVTERHRNHMEAELQQTHAQNDETNFVLDKVKEHTTQVETTASDLLNMCRRATHHEHLLQAKYRHLADLSVNNSSVTNHLVQTCKMCLKDICQDGFNVARQQHTTIDQLLSGTDVTRGVLLRYQQEERDSYRKCNEELNLIVGRLNELLADHLTEVKSEFPTETHLHQHICDGHSMHKFEILYKQHKKAFETKQMTLCSLLDQYQQSVATKHSDQLDFVDSVEQCAERMTSISDNLMREVTALKTDIVVLRDAALLQRRKCNDSTVSTSLQYLREFLVGGSETVFTHASTTMTQLYEASRMAFDAVMGVSISSVRVTLTKIRTVLVPFMNSLNQLRLMLNDSEHNLNVLNRIDENMEITTNGLRSVQYVQDEFSTKVEFTTIQTSKNLQNLFQRLQMHCSKGDTPAKTTYTLPDTIRKMTNVDEIRQNYRTTFLEQLNLNEPETVEENSVSNNELD